MKNKHKIFYVVPVIHRTPAGKYYFVDDTGGLDSNSGTSQSQAWKTLSKVSGATFNPEDNVLFKGGEIWKAQSLVIPSSGEGGKPIYFGAYGSGANPLFDPTTQFTDFTIDSGAIWKRTDTNEVGQVFEDGVRMIYSAAKAAMVAGSWSKPAGGILYVWCSDGGNPNTTHIIDIVIPANNWGVNINGKSHLVFDNIDGKKAGYAIYGCPVVGSVDILIKNLTVSYGTGRSILIGTNGAFVYTYPTDLTIRNVVGHDDLDVPFWIGHGTRLIVENCESYNNGLDISPGGKLYSAVSHFPNGILVSAEAVDCVVRKNYVHDNYIGSAIIDELSLGLRSSGTIIEKNHVVDNHGSATSSGIKVEGTNPTVRNNWIEEYTGYGIHLNNTPVSPQIFHNTIICESGADRSMFAGTGSNIAIKNNIIVRKGGTVGRYMNILAAAQTGAVIDNNLYYGAATQRWFWGPTEYTTFATWKSGSGKDTNGLNVDPVFVIPYTNLHLGEGSPCIAAGDATVGVTDDYDGVARGAAVDIGCYEHV